MAGEVPWFVWTVVLGADLALIVLLVVALRRHGGARARRLAAGAGAALGAWFAVAVALAAAGAFRSDVTRVPGVGLGLLPPILIGAVALLAWRPVRETALAVPQRWLVGIQSLRAVGVVFLVLLARGTLPPQFALPAGWGDVAVAASAPLVAYALSAGKRWARPAGVAWNVLGLADLAVAIGVGALSAESSVRLFRNAPSTDAMAVLPLALVPVFAVPIFVLLHLASLMGLRARSPRRAGPARPAKDPRSPGTAQLLSDLREAPRSLLGTARVEPGRSR